MTGLRGSNAGAGPGFPVRIGLCSLCVGSTLRKTRPCGPEMAPASFPPCSSSLPVSHQRGRGEGFPFIFMESDWSRMGPRAYPPAEHGSQGNGTRFLAQPPGQGSNLECRGPKWEDPAGQKGGAGRKGLCWKDGKPDEQKRPADLPRTRGEWFRGLWVT